MDFTPTSTSAGTGRIVLFWALFVVGTAILIVGLLFTQTKGNDRTGDVVSLSLAAAFLTTALVVGRSRVMAALFVGAELLICFYALISVLTYTYRR